MTVHPFTTRGHILGLPIGPRGLDWPSILGSALALGYVLGTVEAGVAIKHRIDEARRRWGSRWEEGKHLIEEGEEVIHHAVGIANAASTVGGAVGRATGRT